MISIRLKPASTLQAKSLISLLDANTPLKIIIGDYDKEAQSFISPKSPEGKLLAMEWQAVPALIASLEDERLSFRKRAWILALLFSITLERDLNPMNSDSEIAPRGILKDYEYRGSVMTSVFWKGGASYRFAGDGQRSGGKENLKDQLAFAKKWLQFRVPDSYELRINCSSGGINFDRFVYWPSETYPPIIQDNWTEPIDVWVYVRE